MLLNGKIAVVYGAAGSVGSAVARVFAREGATVNLAGRILAPLEAVAQQVTKDGGAAEAAVVDALDEAVVLRHAAGIVTRAGRLDISFKAIAVDHVRGVPLAELAVEEVVGPVADRVVTHKISG